ncbi:hypothetical protein MRB53_036280 [Persea americana]|nr:hypothetical protein MRB53_036458 [Persea americana]KAJ8614867.1 hypothetical protein MRB53_036280 [Persea americana]
MERVSKNEEQFRRSLEIRVPDPKKDFHRPPRTALRFVPQRVGGREEQGRATREIKWKARRVGMAVDDGQALRINQNDLVDLVFDILLLRLQISEVSSSSSSHALHSQELARCGNIVQFIGCLTVWKPTSGEADWIDARACRGKKDGNVATEENYNTIEISGQTSEEFTPRKGTNSNRLRFGPYCLKFNPLNNRFKNPEPPAGIGLGLDRTPANNTAMGGYLLSFLYRGSSPEIYSSSSASAGSGVPSACLGP